MILMNAELADLPRLLQFRHDAARWLSALGIDQWSKPFPSDHIVRSIEAGTVFVLKDGETTAATITLDRDVDDRIWTPQEAQEPAMYVHKLSVDRAYAGTDLGRELLNWSDSQAADSGAHWLRLDAWTSNPRLQRYYVDHGFRHIRTVTTSGVVSGWVAQKPATRAPWKFADESAGIAHLWAQPKDTRG
jgi:GNAT superfamily N-acetyltransferase